MLFYLGKKVTKFTVTKFIRPNMLTSKKYI